MGIVARIDKLRVDADPIPRALDTSFEKMSDAELLSHLPKVKRHFGLVLHYARAADDFQIGDFCKVSQNFVLDTIGEKSVVRVAAQIFKWQHGDALLRNGARCRYRGRPLRWCGNAGARQVASQPNQPTRPECSDEENDSCNRNPAFAAARWLFAGFWCYRLAPS